jgi:hypothetical protein
MVPCVVVARIKWVGVMELKMHTKRKDEGKVVELQLTRPAGRYKMGGGCGVQMGEVGCG